MSKENNYNLVIVKWVDICATAGWEDPDEVEPIEVQSVGWLYSNDGETVKVGSTLGDDGRPYGVTAIPFGCVSEINPVCSESPEVHRAEPLTPSLQRQQENTTHLRPVGPLNSA